MTVYFRADASATIGSGHVMRCLTLADQLRDQGLVCHFLCRSLPQSLQALVVARGHEVTVLPSADVDNAEKGSLTHSSWLGTSQFRDAQDCLSVIGENKAEWIVVDHYALDAEWESLVRGSTQKLMAIDDLADRHHVCDLLLDQNLGHSPKDYRGLVPSHCQMMTGPAYALLRPEFAAIREESLGRRAAGTIQHILITMGGFDNDNVTSDVLNALTECNLPDDCRVTVVMGSQAPWLNAVRDLCATMPFAAELRTDVSDMANLMVQADLSIGAAGGTAWERCCLGLPTLMLVLADNQKSGAKALGESGCARILPTGAGLPSALRQAMSDLSNPEAVKAMQSASARLTRGQGAKILAVAMLAGLSQQGVLRKMTEADLELVLYWRNHVDVRRFMLTQGDIAFEPHRNWFLKSQENSARHLMIYEDQGTPLGFMNISVDESNNVADWGFYVAPGAAKGTGSKMGRAAIDYAFDTIGVHKICGQVLEFNAGSLRFHEKLGFTEEGALREQALINNTYHALVCFGLLKREWLQSNARVN